MRRDDLKINFLFMMTQLCYWSTYGAFYGFMVMYLTAQGYDGIFCGAVTTGFALISIIWQPILGYLIDTYISAKQLVMLSFAIALPLVLLLPRTIHPAWLCFLMLMLISMFTYSQHIILDAWTIKIKDQHPAVNFGVIRSCAGIGNGLASIICGNLIARFGFDAMFILKAVLLLFCILFCALQLSAPCLNNRKYRPQQEGNILACIRELLRVRPYVTFLLSGIFFQFAMRCTTTYLSMYIQAAGGGAEQLGYGVAVSAACEVVLMMFVSGALLKRGVPMEYLYLLAILGHIIRLVSLAAFRTVPVIVGMQVFNAVGMGLNTRIQTPYVTSLTPIHLRGMATTFGMAISWGIGSVLGNLCGGAMIQYVGLTFYALFSAAMLVVSFLLFLPNLVVVRKNRKIKILSEKIVLPIDSLSTL